MTYARAYANNDVVMLAWDPGGPLAGCLGFDIRRHEPGKQRHSLPTWVGFSGDDPASAPKTTATWPIQKYTWRDLTAAPGHTYVYDIIPMVGTPGALTRTKTVLTTNPVTLTPQCSEHVQAFFNRGILATQHLAKILKTLGEGDAAVAALVQHISTPGDSIRLGLAHQLIDAVTELLSRADTEGGHCYAALYELADAELVAHLNDVGRISLVLSNAGDGAGDQTNAAARVALHTAGVDITDRMLGDGHIGHNKFVVYCDASGTPAAVLTGSTNWTPTGLCCQSNNALVIDDPAVAASYLQYWQQIKAESQTTPATQSPAYRTANQQPATNPVDGGTVTRWRSPNTQQQTKPTTNPARPVDLVQVFDLIGAARHGVVFLLFQPGTPSVLDAVLDAQTANPALFVRGAATDPKAIGDYSTDLYHRTGSVAQVAAVSAIGDDFAFWQKELLKLPDAHAVIHDKILVIDPFSPAECVVVTGSHNLGYRASYNNDDNLVIVRGNPNLAAAYTTHVLDVYEHYRWRYTLQTQGQQAWTGLSKSPAWQNKYTAPAIHQELDFFGQGITG